jgi:Lon protease-like protein
MSADGRILYTGMQIPIFPLQVVLFPGASLPLHIFEPRYKDMMLACQSRGLGFGVVHSERGELAVTGCMASLVCVLQQYDDGRMDILTRGAQRFKIVALDESRSYLQAEVNFLHDDADPAPRALRESAVAQHFEFLELTGGDAGDMSLLQLDQPVSFHLANMLPIPFTQLQALLSTDSDHQRTAMLIDIYEELLPQLRLHGADSVTDNGAHRSHLVH